MEHLGPAFLPLPVLRPAFRILCREDIGVLQIGRYFFLPCSLCLPSLLARVCAHPGHVPVGQRDGGQRDGSFLRGGVPDGSTDLESTKGKQETSELKSVLKAKGQVVC